MKYWWLYIGECGRQINEIQKKKKKKKERKGKDNSFGFFPSFPINALYTTTYTKL
jgi:hypothetical protein